MTSWLKILLGLVGTKLVFNIGESVVDNAFRDTVYPRSGSILYRDLVFGAAEHSGVYVGNGEIVHLAGNGNVELVSIKEFIGASNKSLLLDTAVTIYVSSRDGEAVGSEEVAKRAKKKVGINKEYSLPFNNCHQFSAGCLLGEFDSGVNSLLLLKNESNNVLRSNEWRAWDLDSDDIF